jgi:RimJ/RimL family protein N-acetyltransferase
MTKGIFENHTLRRLEESDVSQIQDLCDLCSDYYMMDKGHPAEGDEAQNILKALPPDKTLDDQYNIGFFDGDEKLIALIHIVDGYPDEGTWMLGLMLVDPAQRQIGLGSYFHGKLLEFVKSKNGKRIRIGIFEDNEVALKFWKTLGYKYLKTWESDRGNNRMKTVLVFSLEI